jgi:hypothetical protein
MAPIRLTRLPGAMVTPAALLRLTLRVPVEVKSEANQRCHWAVRHRRFRGQQDAIDAAVLDTAGVFGQFIDMLASGHKASVTFTRLGGRALDDDNLNGAFKAIRDRIAGYLNVDDADPRLTFHYSQEPGKLIGVRVTIESSEGT